MPEKVRVFLDTSALFAGIWSAEGGARMILKLGEAEAVKVLVSSQMLSEIENVLRRKAPASLGLLAVLLDRSGVEVAPSPPPEIIQQSEAVTGHASDAYVLAAAWLAKVDYLVTLDRQHFLDNPAVRTVTPFPIGTPGDFLAWYRARLS
ncbi:MAG: PIN domain-containing protein [Anaerolineales bacterium]|nr:PIN domain-containing protein [Anaerolineales bacterium]